MSILGFSVIFPQEIPRGISVLAVRVSLEPVVAGFCRAVPGVTRVKLCEHHHCRVSLGAVSSITLRAAASMSGNIFEAFFLWHYNQKLVFATLLEQITVICPQAEVGDYN